MKIDWRNTLELLTPAQMAQADAMTIAGGIAGHELMERAGAAVAAEAARLALPASRGTPRIAVLCGPGNNGGDGYVAARLLAERGFDVRVAALGGALRGDAASAARTFAGPFEAAAGFDPGNADLVIDALFGAGLARDLEGEARQLVERLNAWRTGSQGKIVAVDVPSGLDGGTGRICGAAVEADSTVTFFRLKPGHLLMPGRQLCGELHLSHIGIPSDVCASFAPAAFLNGPRLWESVLPTPQPQGHKYARGHVLVVSGPVFQTGAARLAARSAARVGAGLVTVAGSRDALRDHAAHLTAIMLAPCENASDLVSILADARKNALVIGPGLGLGPDARALVDAALSPASGRSAVLDADALTLAAADPAGLRDRIAAFGGPVVLTPHEGEFSRFANYLDRLPDSVSEPVDSKLSRARRLARALHAIVLLKGPDTIVAAPDGRASIATDLPAELATAGSGDVLTGMIAGLLAQGMAAFEAASAAVWLHGKAGRVGGRGLTADDLPEALADVLKDVGEKPALKRKEAADRSQRPKSREETPKKGWVGASAKP